MVSKRNNLICQSPDGATGFCRNLLVSASYCIPQCVRLIVLPGDGGTPHFSSLSTGSFFTMIYVDKKNKVRVISLVVVYATIFGVRAAFRLICGDQSNNALGTLAGTSVKLKVEHDHRHSAVCHTHSHSVSVTVNTSWLVCVWSSNWFGGVLSVGIIVCRLSCFDVSCLPVSVPVHGIFLGLRWHIESTRQFIDAFAKKNERTLICLLYDNGKVQTLF